MKQPDMIVRRPSANAAIDDHRLADVGQTIDPKNNCSVLGHARAGKFIGFTSTTVGVKGTNPGTDINTPDMAKVTCTIA